MGLRVLVKPLGALIRFAKQLATRLREPDRLDLKTEEGKAAQRYRLCKVPILNTPK